MYVYILTNERKTVLYTGVTSQLCKRIAQHKTKYYPNSFSARYGVDKLVWYEYYHSKLEAIRIEKLIKAGSRKAKIKRINGLNPQWRDLWDDVNAAFEHGITGPGLARLK